VKRERGSRSDPQPHQGQGARDQDECPLCYRGVVYIGYLVPDDSSGVEVEVIVGVPCRRCRGPEEGKSR
jgi:hypothetical protein